MRISILILIVLSAASAFAQERSPQELYGRPVPVEEAPPSDAQPSDAPPEAAQPQGPADLWGKVQQAISALIPPQQPGQSPADAAAALQAAQMERQTLWDAATKLSVLDESDTDAPTQQPVTTPHSKQECLDPDNFQPGAAGCLDYFLFKVVDVAPNELYLAPEVGQKLFCLTNVDTEELEPDQPVVILGNVRVRGTKTYKTEQGDKLTVRVVKLLDAKESELVEAERALQSAAHPIRTWTSKDGKHKIEARFLKFEGGKVHLVNGAGKNVSISPNNLSVADREYYRDLVKKAREEARKKVEEEPADAPLDLESERGPADRIAPQYGRE